MLYRMLYTTLNSVKLGNYYQIASEITQNKPIDRYFFTLHTQRCSVILSTTFSYTNISPPLHYYFYISNMSRYR